MSQTDEDTNRCDDCDRRIFSGSLCSSCYADRHPCWRCAAGLPYNEAAHAHYDPEGSIDWWECKMPRNTGGK